MEIKSFKLVKKEALLFTAAIAALTVVAMYFGVYTQVRDSENALRLELDNENQKLTALNNIQASLKQIGLSEAYLELDADIANFVKRVNEIARVSNIKIKSIEPLKSEALGDYIKLAVSVEVDSPYHSAAKFVENIENYAKFMKIEKMDISLSESEAQMARILLKEGGIDSAKMSSPVFAQGEFNLSAPARKTTLHICTYIRKR